LLTTEAAADYVAVSPETLRRMCRQKVISFVQVTPGEYRFDENDLREYINSRRNRRTSALGKKPTP
jgi:excisionase family DNA binding protein